MENARHLAVRFYKGKVENKLKSKKEGRPIFEMKEFVEIKFAGDRNRVHHAPADEKYRVDPEMNGQWISYKEDFPKHYEKFKEGEEFQGEGTPLSEFGAISEAQRAELKALNIHTIEALAALEGTQLQRLGMSGRDWKNKAQIWLDDIAGKAPAMALAAQKEELLSELTAMKAEMAAMRAQMAGEAASAPDDEFAAYSSDDLKTMIKDATGETPRGNPKRDTLVEKLREIAAEKEAA